MQRMMTHIQQVVAAGLPMMLAMISMLKPVRTLKRPAITLPVAKVSESGSHTDNNADSRVDQLSAALNSAKQSYDQYTTNMTRSHEYAEMASRTESMSGQMSEDLSQQFAQYVMKHAPQDAEAILTNTSSPEIAERRRAMAWSFVQEQVQPGVDNAGVNPVGILVKGWRAYLRVVAAGILLLTIRGIRPLLIKRTQDSNIRNDVKHQVDNMVTEYKGNIGDTQNSIHGKENIVDRQYSELKNNHKQEEIQQNNRYNEENKRQKLMPTPSEDALKQMVDDKKRTIEGAIMITHYDIKMEMQKLKEVLSVEGVNIPSLLQVIKPGTYVFLWVLLWPTFLRLVSVKSDVRDVGFDICASGMMGFLLFVAITNGMMLYLAIPDSFRKDSKIINFMYSKSKTYILLFLIVFSMVSFMHSILYVFALMITFILFFLVYTIDINRYNLSAIASVIGLFKKESVS